MTPLSSPSTTDPALLATRFQRWTAGTGPQVGGAAHAQEILAAAGADLAALFASGLVGPDTMVFAETAYGAADPAPDRETGAAGQAGQVGQVGELVPVRGSIHDCGDELVVGDELYVQVFDYLSVGFLTVAGPTVVRITCDEDLVAFLADAERAVAEGTLPEQLVHPAVQLADLGALAGHPAPGLARLYLDADGTVRSGPGGPALAGIADGAAAVAAAVSRQATDSSLDAVLSPGALEQARRERPWLPRYLRAVQAVRRVGADPTGPGAAGGQPRVSGFGGRICPGAPAAPHEAADAPLLVRAGDTCYLVDCRSADRARLFRLGPDAAVLVDAELSGADGALAAAALGLPADTGAARVAELRAALAARLPLTTLAASC